MKIESAALGMEANHHSLTLHERHESLQIWRGAGRANTDSGSSVSISGAARRALAADTGATHATTGSGTTSDVDPTDSDPFLGLLKSMIEFLTGRPVKVFSAAELQPQEANDAPQPTPATSPARSANGLALDYERHEVYEEFESTTLTAEGVVRTSDGREIRFSLSLAMERHYREESHTSVRIGEAARKDPLVINFDGSAAQLLDRSFRFDLDDDGTVETLPLLAGGNGYLAFDRNGNGRIDSGRELFGPLTDHGFGELARLDADTNGWIDEADPSFARLGIWQPAAEGPGELRSLTARGIGAIGLTQIATPFELRGSGNRELGAIRSTAVALTEAGNALPVQELDLTIA
jgi:hypothetical protein